MMKLRYVLARSLTACAVLALAACQSPQYRAYKAKVGAEQAYEARNRPEVDAGRMKESDYLTGLYTLATRPPILQQDVPFIKSTSALIDLARQKENGQISPQQYDSMRRQIVNNGLEETTNIQAQQAEADQARKRAALDFYLRAKPVTTNCTQFGANSSCTTY